MAAPPAPTPLPPLRAPSLRIRGVALLVGAVVEIFVGNELALAGSPYPILWLGAHVLLAFVVIAFAGHAAGVAVRAYGGVAQLIALLALLSAIGAGLAGALFLVGGESNTALEAMEGLAGLVVLLAIVLIAVGGSPRRAT